MARISIATVFTDELEKSLREHLPPKAVRLLCLMAEQMMEMERGMNVQQEMILKLMKFAVLSKPYQDALAEQQKKFDKQFDNAPAMSEKIKEDE